MKIIYYCNFKKHFQFIRKKFFSNSTLTSKLGTQILPSHIAKNQGSAENTISPLF